LSRIRAITYFLTCRFPDPPHSAVSRALAGARADASSLRAALSASRAERDAASARAAELDALLAAATAKLRQQAQGDSPQARDAGARGGSASSIPTDWAQVENAHAQQVSVLRSRVADLSNQLSRITRENSEVSGKASKSSDELTAARAKISALETRLAESAARFAAADREREILAAEKGIESANPANPTELDAMERKWVAACAARDGLARELALIRACDTSTRELVIDVYNVDVSIEASRLEERNKALEREVASLVGLPRELGKKQADRHRDEQRLRDSNRSLERKVRMLEEALRGAAAGGGGGRSAAGTTGRTPRPTTPPGGRKRRHDPDLDDNDDDGDASDGRTGRRRGGGGGGGGTDPFASSATAEEIARLEADVNAQRDKYHQLHVKHFEVSDDLSLANRAIKRLEADLEASKAKVPCVFF
jgi:chromosome segregation ATPase